MNDVALRILLAFLGSLLFGLERQWRKKPVGFGAFSFVTIGACVMALVAQDISETPIVLFGAIMTGIGFLGAGAILKQSDRRVHGITTAASIWVFAAFGLTLGVGDYWLAGTLYALIFVIIIVDQQLERHGFGDYSKTVTLTMSELGAVKEIERMLPRKHKTLAYRFDNKEGEYTISFLVSGSKREINTTLNELVKQPFVTNVAIE